METTSFFFNVFSFVNWSFNVVWFELIITSSLFFNVCSCTAAPLMAEDTSVHEIHLFIIYRCTYPLCKYVWMYVCMHVCFVVHVWFTLSRTHSAVACICVCLCIYLCMLLCICVYAIVYMYVCCRVALSCMCVCLYVCMHICFDVCFTLSHTYFAVTYHLVCRRIYLYKDVRFGVFVYMLSCICMCAADLRCCVCMYACM